jgi:hypothetical protein
MTGKRARMLLIGLALGSVASEANSACLTHAQARAAYGFGLRWHGEGGKRCWGPTKSSTPKTGRSFSSPVRARDNGDTAPAIAVAETGPLTWVFDDRGVNSPEFTPRRLDDNPPPVEQARQPSAWPDRLTGILLLMLASCGLLTVCMLGREAWGHYASRRGPAARTGGNQTLARLLWLLTGLEAGGLSRDTRPPHPPWPGAGELEAQGGGQQR